MKSMQVSLAYLLTLVLLLSIHYACSSAETDSKDSDLPGHVSL